MKKNIKYVAVLLILALILCACYLFFNGRNEKASEYLTLTRDVKKGEIITADDLASGMKIVISGDTLLPENMKDIIGKKAVTDLKAGTELYLYNFE